MATGEAPKYSRDEIAKKENREKAAQELRAETWHVSVNKIKTPEEKKALSERWMKKAGLTENGGQADIYKLLGDPQTAAEFVTAVEAYQEKHGLKKDGILWWATLEKMDNDVNQEEDRSDDETDSIKWLAYSETRAENEEKRAAEALKDVNSPEYKAEMKKILAWDRSQDLRDPAGNSLTINEQGIFAQINWEERIYNETLEKWETSDEKTKRISEEKLADPNPPEQKKLSDPNTAEYRANMNDWAARAKKTNLSDGIQQLEEILGDETVLQEGSIITRSSDGKKEFWDTISESWQDIRLSPYDGTEGDGKTGWLGESSTNELTEKWRNIVKQNGDISELPIQDILTIINKGWFSKDAKFTKDSPLIQQAQWIIDVYGEEWWHLTLKEFNTYRKDDFIMAKDMPTDKGTRKITMPQGFGTYGAEYTKSDEIISKKVEGTLYLAKINWEWSGKFIPADEFVLNTDSQEVVLPGGWRLEAVKDPITHSKKVIFYQKWESEPKYSVKAGKEIKLTTPV